MPNMSRAQLHKGVAPNQWSVLFLKEDPYRDPVYTFHQTHVHLESRLTRDEIYGLSPLLLYTSTVRVKVQESEDGVTWTDRYVHATDLNPGGMIDFQTYNVARWVRVLLFASAGTGAQVDAVIGIPEDQVLPQLKENVALSCSTFCECDCETGSETSDDQPSV